MKPIDPATAWQPYSPAADNPWDLKKVGHLHRRAGFGASWDELQAGLKSDPQELVGKLLKGGEPGPNYDAETDRFLTTAARKFNAGSQAAAWWLYRMLNGGHPLREKLALFWHNHFATSNAKVQNVGHMVGQYELIHQHALGKFDALLLGMSRDPAMMIWLDTVLSRKGEPNENYARELMELFSLGIGHYSEKDIREAARAFTGWEIKDGKFHDNKAHFDAGDKTVLGKSGPFTGDDIVRLCLSQKAAAPFIVRKAYRFLVSESHVPTDAEIAPLVGTFAKDWDFGRLVETILRSRHFFSPTAYRARIKSPVDFVLGIARALESRMGTQNASVNMTAALETLGQNLFHPPSVKGWDGGQAWLNGQTLLFRQNFARELAQRSGGYEEPAAAFALAERHGKKTNGDLADFLLGLLLQHDVSPETQQQVRAYARSGSTAKKPSYWTERDAQEDRAVGLCHLVMTLPEYQLD